MLVCDVRAVRAAEVKDLRVYIHNFEFSGKWVIDRQFLLYLIDSFFLEEEVGRLPFRYYDLKCYE